MISVQSSLRFARRSPAQSIARDVKAAGREQDIEYILDHVSSTIPDNAPERI